MDSPDKKNVRHYLEILHTLSNESVIGLTPEERLTRLVSTVARELHWDVCSIYILEPGTGELVLAATQGLNPESVGKVRLPLSEGLVGSAVCEEKPLFFANSAADPRFKYFSETGEEKYHSMAAVPFARDGKISGVLCVQTLQPYKFSTADKHFLEILANQIGQAVDVALSLKTLGKSGGSILVGTPAAAGIAEARIHIIASSADKVEILARGFKGTEFEKGLFDNALKLALMEIDALLAQLDNPQEGTAQIFAAHSMILQDPEFIKKVHSSIERKKHSAPRAVTFVMDEYITKFSSFKNRIIKEKVHDLKDMRDSLLRLMGEKISQSSPKFEEEQMVIVAHELTPQQTVRLDPKKVVAFVTESGSEFSHAVILARALQLPAVVGVTGIVDAVKPGDSLLVDGNSGFVYINPDRKIKRQYMEESASRQKRSESIRQALSRSTESSQLLSQKVSVDVNIGLPFEIEQTVRKDIQSVGLLRTEFFYMRQQSWPDEELQTQFYERILRSFSSGTVTIRLLDIGGDKFLQYLPTQQEDNSYFGFRSIRFLLDRPEILRSQLQSIHNSAENSGCTPKILIPMVTHAWEITAVREALLEATNGKAYPLGVMIEIPAALFQIKELIAEADFISIGTNDLSQYLMAVDRNDPRLTHLYHPLHPAILRALDYLFQRVAGVSKVFSICGEMAGDPLSALALLVIGFRRFSISPSRVLEIQYLVRNIPEKILQGVRDSIINSGNAKETEKMLRSVIRKHAPLL